MPDRPRIWVWCEDREHEAFARSLLIQEGTRARDIDCKIAPAGSGSASAWVMQQYPEIVRQARSKKHQATAGFLVIIDGDNVGVEGRLNQIAAQDRGSERLAVFVPTWSIETWVLSLSGEQVSEERSYKQELKPSDFRRALPEAVRKWGQPQRTAPELPSLSAARIEFERLPLRS